jgi:Predicted permease.
MKNRVIKVILFAVALAMSFIIIGKLYFIKTYDNHIPDKDRIYFITANFSQQGKEGTTYLSTPGGISKVLKEQCSNVEAYTRLTSFGSNLRVVDELNIEWNIPSIYFTDDNFFNIFSRECVAGNFKEAMLVDFNIALPKSLAKKISEDVALLIGKKLKYNKYELTIAAVYEDFPKNSLFNFNPVFMSLKTIKNFMYDGSENLYENDRYWSFIKLNNDDCSVVELALRNIEKEYLPLDEFAKANIKYQFSFIPFSESLYYNDENLKLNIIIFSILSIILLLVASFNYVLFSISDYAKQAKPVAVLKCYGASKFNIATKLFKNVLTDVVLSVILACIIILAFTDTINNLVGESIADLIQGKIIFILLGIVFITFIIAGLIPSLIYANIPVSNAFKQLKDGAKWWKNALLFLQFTISMLFITLFIIVALQYKKAINTNVGYNYENLVYVNLEDLSVEKRFTLMEEVKKLTYVSNAVLSNNLPLNKHSGNFIIDTKNPDVDVLNVVDNYYVTNGYFDLMGIEIVEGKDFSTSETALEVMVSESCSKELSKLLNWQDGCIGKSIIVKDHNLQWGANTIYTICGVYKDYLLGNQIVNDKRSSIQFNYNKLAGTWNTVLYNLLIRLKPEEKNAFEQLQTFISNFSPDKELILKNYKNEYIDTYSDTKKVKDIIMFSTIIILIITLIGLIAYSIDEINNRKKEIAIRKINGATTTDRLATILKKSIILSVIAIILGGIIAKLSAGYFISMFTNQISLNVFLFTACGILTFVVIITVQILVILKKIQNNMVENLTE